MRLLSRIHPLLLFVLIGGVLFAIDSLSDGGIADSPNIDVSQTRIEIIKAKLRNNYVGVGDVTDEMVSTAIEEYVDNEILFREALALQLHLSDELVRRRLAQTMTFVIEGKAEAEHPTKEQLEAVYRRLYENDNGLLRYSFRHLYFSSDKRGNDALSAAVAAKQAIAESGDVAQIGDPFISGYHFKQYSLSQVQDKFGVEFAQVLSGLDIEEWSNPVRSAYGFHLICPLEVDQLPPPAFVEVQDKLILEWRAQRRIELRKEMLAQLRGKYRVKLPDVL